MNDLQKRYVNLKNEINDFEKLRAKQIAQKEFAEQQCQNILTKHNVQSIQELENKYFELKTKYEQILTDAEEYLNQCKSQLNNVGSYNG